MITFDQEVQELLDEAMKQPGVAEVMATYAEQQIALKALSDAQNAIAPKWIFSTSTSSS